MSHYLDDPAGWTPPNFADIYDETSLWGARFGAMLLDHLEIRRGICGLDVGCATGFPLIELAQVHGTSSHFTGIDIWPEALERARLKVQEYGLTNIDIIEADAGSMPFPDEHFDLVVANLGINNFPDAPKALRECRRVSKTGARLVLTTNVRGHFSTVYTLLDVILGGAGLEAAREALHHDEQHRHSKETLTQFLAEGGFAVSRTFEQSFVMRFADGSAMLRHSLVKWFLDGWRQAIGSERESSLFALLEDQLNVLAEHSGCLEMTVPMLYIEGIAQ